jgi:cell division protein FtsB
MEQLPAILESMRLSLIATTALVAFGFVVTTLMLYRQSQILRDVSKQVADSEALVRDTHALTAKVAAALDSVSRLVVHAGGRTPPA